MNRRPEASATVEAFERLVLRPFTDGRALREAALAMLRRTVGFDWYAWILTDPVTEVGTDPLAEVPDPSEIPRLVRLKYLTAVNRWTTLDTVSLLGDQRSDSQLWRDVQSRHGVRDVVSVVLRDQFGCWAFLDLWSRHVYDRDALDLLRGLAPVLAAALRRSAAATFAIVVDAPSTHEGAAVLLFDDDLELLGRTPTSKEWLAQLLPTDPGRDPVPAAALNVAAQLLARDSGVDLHPPEARVHLRGGLWVTLKAARVPPSPLIAVTMEASNPAERLDLYLRSHALSPRERELVTLLAQGHPTKEVAIRMFLSEHTVQDHVKSIFAKTNTHNRRTLLAHALGVKSDGP